MAPGGNFLFRMSWQGPAAFVFVVVVYLGFCELFRGTCNGVLRAKCSVSYCRDRGARLAFASRNLNVPWVRAPVLRHSVGTCHRRFVMARWARSRFALLWVYCFSFFLCVGPNCRVVELSDVGLPDVGLSGCRMSGCSGNGFPHRWGGH